RSQRWIFIGAEVAYTSVYLVTTYLLVDRFGLDGAGAAFAISYAFHGLLLYPIVRRLTGFGWSGENRRAIAVYLATCLGVFWAHELLSVWVAAAIGVVATTVTALHSARALAVL